jgi:hypothetical protein
MTNPVNASHARYCSNCGKKVEKHIRFKGYIFCSNSAGHHSRRHVDELVAAETEETGEKGKQNERQSNPHPMHALSGSWPFKAKC